MTPPPHGVSPHPSPHSPSPDPSARSAVSRNAAPLGRLDGGMTGEIADAAPKVARTETLADAQKATLTVDIWSDVACPWCYIGKRRFEEGVRRYQQAEGARPVDVEYHSFELAPDTPVDFEGSEVDFLARHKGMPAEQVHQLVAHVTELAAAEGLAYDFDALRHTNTRKAHQVLHLAKAHGLQRELKERLLRAYFVEGRHVGRDDSLAELAAEVGLDADLVLAALREGTSARLRGGPAPGPGLRDHRRAVLRDRRRVRRLGSPAARAVRPRTGPGRRRRLKLQASGCGPACPRSLA